MVPAWNKSILRLCKRCMCLTMSMTACQCSVFSTSSFTLQTQFYWAVFPSNYPGVSSGLLIQKWPYPSCLLGRYLVMKGICYYFCFCFCSSHSVQFHFFSGKTCYPHSSNPLKNVKGIGTCETRYLSTAAFEKKALKEVALHSSVRHSTQWYIFEK